VFQLSPKRPAAANALYKRIADILESARVGVARTVNTTQVLANWLIGREIVEAEQSGRKRAKYGDELIRELAQRLSEKFGRGYSPDNLFWFRRFYVDFPDLLKGATFDPTSPNSGQSAIVDALRQISEVAKTSTSQAQQSERVEPLPSQPWHPGLLNPNLSWTHYRTLLRVNLPDARSFYEIEASVNRWSARELERQINSLLYDRLAASKDKRGVLRLAQKGQEITAPLDVFKDPLVLEFLKIPAAQKLVESDVEKALLSQLQSFLLELGKGFAFVSRQQRITIEGDHFYVDLVFYHTVLKCYVLVDLKVGKLTHQDLGQLQLYVNYYDRERLTPGDQPTLGLILCTDKNDAVVRYTLGPDQEQRIFASRYQLHLPTAAQLRAEIKRELRFLI